MIKLEFYKGFSFMIDGFSFFQVIQTYLVTLGFVVFSFFFYVKTKKMSVIDVFWSLFHLFQALVCLSFASRLMAGLDWLVFLLILLWAFRLSIYLGVRFINKEGDDPRYLNLSKSWKGHLGWNVFVRIFLGQFFILTITSLCLSLSFLSSQSVQLNLFSFAGFFISIFGLIYEAIADHQLYCFKKENQKGVVMDKGLWRFSRHPNYFGEISFWWGIFFISTSNIPWYLGLISPLTVTYLLTRFSGVPMLEERYKGNEVYLNYIRSTNTLIPGPNKRGYE